VLRGVRSGARERALPLSLAAACYALALLQRPGLASSDTKIDLHVDPSGFLGDVAAVWSPTGSLGHIQGGQYGGYLWPMGPFFALLHSAGLGPWVVQRLWLGTLLFLGAWGVVRLLDALLSRSRGAAHVVAAVLFVANPYVVVFSSRTTITLLGYAALPWLLLAVHRGVRSARPWWWAAAFGLVVTSTGGGVNAAVTGWLLVGPLLLLVYEPLVCGAGWRGVRAFAWRAAVASVAASVWWIVPVLVQAGYGIDFLKFTEQVGSIWNTTSLTESLRLMGYWPSYLGVGYGDVLRPYFGTSGTMLFSAPVVVSSLLVPALALWGFVWTRRWRYGPFFLLLALTGLLVMSVGFPEGTPLRKAATFAYNHVQAVQFLRTTYKAGPLLALAIACLGGAGAAELWGRAGAVRARLGSVRRVVASPAALGLVFAALVVLASLPLFEGRAVELTWKRIPAAWTAAAHDLDRSLQRGTRALVLPGQPFAFYRWGGTVDPILPSLTNRPVAIRNVPPYDDLHAVDLLWTTDNLVQQQRLVPDELPALLDLLSAGAVVTGADDDVGRSGGMPPAEAARELASQTVLVRPSKTYGPSQTVQAPPSTLDGPARLPEVRRYDIPLSLSRPLVRVEPAAGPTIVDGSAEGLAGLAAFRALHRGRTLLYAGDLDAAAIRRAAAAGAEVAITDSNRRRAFVASRPRQSYGWTLPASEPFSSDAAVLDPFNRGPDAQTVAVYEGATSVHAPFSPQIAQFPEHRPFAAFDGDVATTWIADPTLDDARHWVEADLPAPRDIPYVDVLPDSSNPLVAVTRVDVDGRGFAVHAGWNRLPVGLHGARAVRVTITGHRTLGIDAGSVGGIREVRVPGLRVRELLRPPVEAERALAGQDLSRTGLTYLFERTTADDPLRRGPEPSQSSITGNRAEDEAALVRTAQDPETGIARVFSPPAARSWQVGGQATTAPGAQDTALDRLAGARFGGAAFTSSGRFEGRPGWRASSVFDGDASSSWASPWQPGRAAWIAWSTPRPRTVRRLVLVRAPLPARTPTSVRVSYPGGRSAPLAVGPGGVVELPRPVRARSFRLDVLAAGGSVRPAVAIAELRGPGVPRVRVPRSGPVAGRCGDLTGVATSGAVSRRIELRARGSIAALDAGEPLRMEACGAPLALPAGQAVLRLPAGVLRPLALRLRSPAPDAAAHAVPAPPGRVTDPGRMGRGNYNGVRVQVDSPGWLVLGESYDRGWHADCDGRSLGAPKVVDAFANGWRVAPGCHDVSFTFAPQRAVDWGYAIGALACLVLLALVVLRRRRAADDAAAAAAQGPPAPIEPDDRPWRLPARQALLAGLAAAAVFGFAFALRAGVAIGPAVALAMWRGLSARAMITAAGALLAIVVPALYVLFPGTDRGGYDTAYPVQHLGAHWVAVAAVVLLVLALARTLSTASPSSRARRAAAADAPAARSAP
jgi:arabinofuranan 3-O-arabinosyltransferase